MGVGRMAIKQQITIEWHDLSVMPEEEGTYLVAFDDGSVETYPMSYDDIRTGIIQDGYARGILWAHKIYGPLLD